MYKIVKVITDEKITSKDGKSEFRKTYYAVELENGSRVLIKPVFKDGYGQLDLISDKSFVNKEGKK